MQFVATISNEQGYKCLQILLSHTCKYVTFKHKHNHWVYIALYPGLLSLFNAHKKMRRPDQYYDVIVMHVQDTVQDIWFELPGN